MVLTHSNICSSVSRPVSPGAFRARRRHGTAQHTHSDGCRDLARDRQPHGALKADTVQNSPSVDFSPSFRRSREQNSPLVEFSPSTRLADARLSPVLFFCPTERLLSC